MCNFPFFEARRSVRVRRALAYQSICIFASKKPRVARGFLLPLCMRIIAFFFQSAFHVHNLWITLQSDELVAGKKNCLFLLLLFFFAYNMRPSLKVVSFMRACKSAGV